MIAVPTPSPTTHSGRTRSTGITRHLLLDFVHALLDPPDALRQVVDPLLEPGVALRVEDRPACQPLTYLLHRRHLRTPRSLSCRETSFSSTSVVLCSSSSNRFI